MPAAVLIGGLVVIALAFAAIAADLLIRNLVIQPLNGAAAAVAEVAVVGGVIAWILSHLVTLIEVALDGVHVLVGTAEQQAADMWNYLVGQTAWVQFGWAWSGVSRYINHEVAILYAATNFPNLNAFVWNNVVPVVRSTEQNLANLNAFVWNNVLTLAQATAGDLAGLHQWIDGYELPLIRGIGNDLAGLRDWVSSNVATHSDVARAGEQTLARAQALVVPIAAAVTALEDSPCIKACEPLGNIGNLIQGLEDAGMLAIMLALIEETRRDPQAVQNELRSIVVPIVTDAVSSTGLSD